MEDIVAIITGTVSSIIGAFVFWLFRVKLRELLDTLDITFHQLFSYLLILIILTVFIISHFMGKESPTELLGILGFIVGAVIIYYFSPNRK